MKKVKLIGTLLAAVIVSAPATGIVGNVLSFNDNAIVAEAAGSSITVSKGIFHVSPKNSPVVILQNSNWDLVANSNGDLYSRFRNGSGRKTFSAVHGIDIAYILVQIVL